MKTTKINNLQSNNALILRMAPYFTTQAIPRIANYLKGNGFHVSILSIDKNNEYPSVQEINSWKVYWYKINYVSGNKLSFLLGWIKWWLVVLKHIKKIEYTVIHAMNLESIIPIVLGKYLLLKKYRIIYDVRDPWGMLFPEGFNPIKSFIVFIDRIVSSKVDGIVLSQGILKKTGDYFGIKTRKKIPIAQVLNVPHKDLIGKHLNLNMSEPIRINFSGHISYKRNAQAVIDLANELSSSVRIDVIGPIRDKKLLNVLEKIRNIKIYGYLSFNEAMEYLKKADLVLILYDTSTDVALVSSANKMFESMMLSKPYIASKNSFPGLVAEKYKIGYTVPFGDSQALIKLLEKILQDSKQLQNISRNARHLYESEFKWEKQEHNIDLLYDTILNKKKYDFSSYGGWNKILGSYYSI